MAKHFSVQTRKEIKWLVVSALAIAVLADVLSFLADVSLWELFRGAALVAQSDLTAGFVIKAVLVKTLVTLLYLGILAYVIFFVVVAIALSKKLHAWIK